VVIGLSILFLQIPIETYNHIARYNFFTISIAEIIISYRILILMIALTMVMIGCSSGPKEDEISVENDSSKETVQEEAADVKTVDAESTETKAKATESSKPEITEETRKTTSETEEIGFF
uniref:hypothetical protein n=1 Tax=Bacteroides caecimuris TaxID=1796613 RepID=UPI002664FEF0